MTAPIDKAAEAVEDNTGLAGIIDGESVARAVFASIDEMDLARVLWSFTGANTPKAINAAKAVKAHLLKEDS